jgi:tetratricopeptide (TPR) repeat protein
MMEVVRGEDSNVDEWDAAWDEEPATPTPIEEPEPSVQISMVDGGKAVRAPRGYETLRPFEEDHWTPGPSGASVARGSTDLPLARITGERAPMAEPQSVLGDAITAYVERPIEPALPPEARLAGMPKIVVARTEREPVPRPITEPPPVVEPRPFTLEVRDTEPSPRIERPQTTSTGALERLQRKNRRWLTAVAIAAPVLLAVAFFLWRRPTQDAVATPPPAIEQPVTKPAEPPAQERSLAQSLFDRAEIAIRNGRVASPPGDNALEFLLDAEKHEPGAPRAKALRGEAIRQLLAAGEELWKAGKQDSARTLYADALLFDGTLELAKLRAKSPRAATEVAPPKDVGWLVAEIDLAIIERRLVAPPGRNALELLQQLRRVDPKNDAVRRLGAEVAAAVGVAGKAQPADARLQAAIKTIAKPEDKPAVETEKPRDPVLARQLITTGNTHLGSGRLAEARAAFERAVAADSGAHAALAGLAEVAYNDSDYTRAVLAAKRAIALAPAASGHRMLLGKAYYKLLRYDDAIKQWKKALDLDPRNTAATKNIEMAQHRMGR